jgi:predicted PurR-regulated permease PerM
MQTTQERSADRSPSRIPPSLDRLTAYSWRFLIIVAAAAVLVWALVRLRLIVIPVIVALFLATLLAPPIGWLRGRGLPKLLATWVVLLGAIAVVGGAFAFIAPQIVDQFGALSQDLRAGSERALEWLAEGPLGISEAEVRRFIDQAAQRLQENSSTLTQGALAGAVKAIEIVTATILTLVVTFFFVKDGSEMWRWLVSRMPAHRHDHINEIGRRTWTTLGAYIRGTALIAIVDAVLIGLALVIVGVPLVMPLALLTFFGAFFPVIGAFTAGLVAVLVALAAGGFLDALIIGIVITGIQQLEGDLLQPIIIGRAVKLHPVVVLLALTAGAILAGVAGAFLAVPIAAVAATIGNYLRTGDESPAPVS